jgi:hypothetical protein
MIHSRLQTLMTRTLRTTLTLCYLRRQTLSGEGHRLEESHQMLTDRQHRGKGLFSLNPSQNWTLLIRYGFLFSISVL